MKKTKSEIRDAKVRAAVAQDKERRAADSWHEQHAKKREELAKLSASRNNTGARIDRAFAEYLGILWGASALYVIDAEDAVGGQWGDDLDFWIRRLESSVDARD